MPNVLITGANRGLGLEFVRQYALDKWRVFACCRNPEKAKELKSAAERHSDLVSIHALDVKAPQTIDNLAAELKDKNIDVLINNAGIYGGSRQSFNLIDYDSWLDTFKVNVLGQMRVAEALVEQVARSEKKTILCMTSKMGSIGDNESGGAYIYRSSKAAYNAVIKSLALDLKSKGITVIAMHPGWVLTDMGGPNALIKPDESISGIKKVLDGATLKDSGSFFDYKGDVVEW